MNLTKEEQKILLENARESIMAKLEEREPKYQNTDSKSLNEKRGAFVTLYINKNLRGCIGRISATEPLIKNIHLMSLSSAFGDPRFPPLTKEEASQCRIEISVLSPLKLCKDPRTVEVGTHGLYLIHKGRSGVLLPQVPIEQGWDLNEYLNYICVKAGLPPNSYNAPSAELYTFTALIFGEEK